MLDINKEQVVPGNIVAIPAVRKRGKYEVVDTRLKDGKDVCVIHAIDKNGHQKGHTRYIIPQEKVFEY